VLRFCFRLYLMLNAYAVRFNVIENLESFLILRMKALFRCEKILDFVTVAFSFVCDKILSNHRLIGVKKFVSRFTGKLCN